MDARGFKIETPLPVVEHDLTTPRGRLLYLRDVVVPKIPRDQLSMANFDCGTHACLAGWGARDPKLRNAGANRRLDSESGAPFFGASEEQWRWMFAAKSYPNARQTSANWASRIAPTHAELRAHINDVLDGRVR